MAKAEEKPEEPVVDTSLAIESVTATKVNELTVTFKNAVATSGASVTVTKGSETISTDAPVWADDCKSVVIKTTANMINGTYTVTVKAGEETASRDAEVTSRHVDKIVILNKVALTGIEADVNGDTVINDSDANSGVYVYYDVLDQYGQSMRESVTIEWNTSCKLHKNDKTRGVLTLIRSDKKAFTYGESVYVTGVHTKTGVNVNETLTVGEKQALHSVEVKGFVKKGTSEILKSLPAGFKSDAYYLVYSVADKNGNEMPAKKYMGGDGDAEVTFVSDNILVIKEIKKADANGDNCEAILTLDGVEYCAAFVEPGINVNQGGEVNITAIANKTGNSKPFNVVVGNNQILKSFTLGQPSGIVADGEKAVIPFTALDQNGEKITNFVTLASQSDFNRLQLNASTGTFVLAENNDGTASLVWTDTDPNYADWNTNSEDGIDRPISLTAVVVGGETSNEMIYVSDKAMPVAIKSADVNSVYVQRAQKKIDLTSFTFIDQYSRPITSAGSAIWKTRIGTVDVLDNGFFKFVNTTGLTGTEFSDYHYGIAIEFKGSDDNLEQLADGAIGGYATITGPSIKHISTVDNTRFDSGAAFEVTSKAAFTVCADQTLKFSIEKIKKNVATPDNSKFSNVSPVKNYTFKGVNIELVSGFEIKDLNTFYVQTDLSDKINGAVGGLDKDNITSSAGIAKLGGATVNVGGHGRTNSIPDDSISSTTPYYQEVKVTGKYNGVTVDVPKMYYTVAGDKLGTCLDGDAVSTSAIGENVIDSVAVSTAAVTLKASDLYDANSAQFTRKLAEDTLKVTVYKASGTAILATKSCIVNTATKKVAISDGAPYAAEIVAADTATIAPSITVINNASTWFGNYVAGTSKWTVKDQYGVNITPTDWAYKVTEVKENADRYADNNFKVDKNDTKDATIKGAECGDTFLLTITAKKGATVTKDVKVTVGADAKAYIDTTKNYYLEQLVDMDGTNPIATPGLEAQRKAALGSN